MTTTHKTNKELAIAAQVIAWQFRHDTELPAWVAKLFHKLDVTGWVAYAKDGSVIKAEPSDWAVIADGAVIVLTHEEFGSLFTAL